MGQDEFFLLALEINADANGLCTEAVPQTNQFRNAKRELWLEEASTSLA